MPAQPPRQASGGFSLIELMIAVALAMALMASIIGVFVSSKQAYRVQDSSGRMQESMRFALEAIGREIRHADFWGGTEADAVTVSGITASATPCSLGWHANPTLPVRGFDGAASSPLAGCTVANYVPNSDVIVLRYADPNTHVAATGAAVTLPGTNADDLILKSLMGRNSVLFRRGNLASADPLVTGLGTEGVYYYPVRSIVLSLGQSTRTTAPDCNTTPRPALCTSTVLYACDSSRQCGITQAPQPLVNDVEQMQLAYGLDLNGDNSADSFVNATAVQAAAAWNRVVSVRVGIVVRGDQFDTFTDGETYDLPGGFTHTPPATGTRFQRRAIVRDFQVRNRVRS